ncbi:MAG: DUF6057 family protein [Verrucomicrobiia bacterium]
MKTINQATRPSARLVPMTGGPGRAAGWGRIACIAAGWAGLYGFLWLYVDPLAWYYSAAPVFSSSREFLTPHLRIPGGLLQWTAAFLGQLSYHTWLGASILLLVAGLLSLGTVWLAAHNGSRSTMLWAVPPLLLTFIASRYVPGLLEVGLAVLMTFICLGLWLARPPRFRIGMVLFSGLCNALFYAAGPFPALVLIVAGALHEIRRERGARLDWFCWLWIAPWLAATFAWCGFDTAGFWTRSGELSTRLAAAGLFALLILPWVERTVLQRLTRKAGALWMPATPRWAAFQADVETRMRHVIRGAAVVLVLGLFVLTLNPEARALRRIHAEAERGNWTAVMKAAASLREMPPAARLRIHRALQHQGRLTSDLFLFPQRFGTDLLGSLMDGLDVCLPLSDTLLDLGHFNLAEHYAHEALEVRGERPEILWRLGWINLLKDRPEAARVFLNRMATVPFHRVRAQHWLRVIDEGTLAGAPEVVEARSRSVTVESAWSHFPTVDLLKMALQSNRNNPAAFDYLVAYYLVTREPEEVLRTLGSQTLADFAVLPRHVTEALLALSAARGSPPVGPGGKPLDAEIVARFTRFREAITVRRPETAEAVTPFAEDFGDTYWFYDVFGQSAKAGPLMRKDQP